MARSLTAGAALGEGEGQPMNADTTSGRSLEQILADYLHAVETGQAPDRDELLARHPDLAGELAAFFSNRDAVERLAQRLGEDAHPSVPATVRYFGDYELLELIARG